MKKNLYCFGILFGFLLLISGCSSTKKIRENTWKFLEQNNESIHYYNYYEDFRAPTESEIQDEIIDEENNKFLFLRLYNPHSSFNIGSNLLQKGIEITETHDTSGSHLSIGFDLTDNFYGLTLYAKPNLKIEHCTDTSTNEYMKSCNPKKSLQTTYALEVSKKEYDTAYAWIKRKVETENAHYDVSENFKIAGALLSTNPNSRKADKPLSQAEEILEFENMNKFVCYTFVCHVLYSSVDNIRRFMNENLIDPDYTTPTDVISMPGIKKLFTSNWNDYNIAAQNFVDMNPVFLDYL